MKKAKDERNPYKELNNNRRAEIFLIPETKQDSSGFSYRLRLRSLDLVLPAGVVVPNVPTSINCDKGERTRFRSDVISFNQDSLLAMSKLREKVDLEKSRAKQDSDGEEKELEVTIRAKNNAWVISRITRGKELYMALEKANENLLYASDSDITKARKIPKRALPIICFKEVSPPLSDASNTSIIDSGYLT
ncbi:vacuolar fusion protein CCZ1-like protein isoform X1 [Cucumis melo var. makuwa]|uniref:Vacuolar fusion protein CCZ1-like protein isoform X1 n=1 Tax=Cucumis melo var. makuwa TaxID=1194695 RepID=A0A5A7T4U8_CUCMM|nr:vacuolar fusion protein CCZ1-like protein isoform X1 [Cucumis melo var. makuwa]